MGNSILQQKSQERKSLPLLSFHSPRQHCQPASASHGQAVVAQGQRQCYADDYAQNPTYHLGHAFPF